MLRGAQHDKEAHSEETRKVSYSSPNNAHHLSLADLFLSSLSMTASSQTNTPIVDFQALKKLSTFVKPYQGAFYGLLLLTFLLGVLAPLQPYLVQRAMDDFLALGDQKGLLQMVTVLVAVLILQSTLHYFQTYLADWLGQHVISDIRTQLYAYILRLRTSFFNTTPIGWLVTRNISDTETLANVLSEGIAALLGDILQMVLIIAFMFYINWWLALLSLTTLPLVLLFTYFFKEKLKRVFQIVRESVAQLNAFTQERIMGMTLVQLFGREQHELEQFKVLNEKHQNAGIQSVVYYSLYFPLISIINALGVSLLIGWGARDVMHGTVTLGQLVAFLMYANLFYRPLHLIADRFNTLQMGLVSMDRIAQLLSNGEQVEDQGTHAPERIQGAITFQQVWFAYKDEHYVLKDLSFQVQAQQSLAIVGATGAGKSTIINLIERFYEVPQGMVSIDGVNLRDYTLPALRRHVGLVPQDVFLFSGSIYDNITLENPDIASERVMEATQRMGMHEFILQLPGGYDYNVMERGMALSMGQRQLLAFARVLVYDPSILILDEATASMDTASEQLIQKATATLMHNRTCLLIAHRLATIQHADKIIVLKEGVLQEEGTHEGLLAQGGYYAALYQAS